MPRGELGPYLLETLLGKGGMGEVHRALDRRTGRRVALKLLPADLARDGQRVARFRQEQAALATLEHPHIVRSLTPVEQIDDVWCFAMELVPPVSLAALLRQRGMLDLPEAVQVALQTLSALAAAHAAGIQHRDIKPSNLLLDLAGRVRVVDFGLARSGEATRLTLTGQIVGTPEYMSPEQAAGKDPDFRSDLYAVGCVLFECLCGRPPFQAAHPLATLRLHLDAPVPRLAEVPEALAAVLDRALTKEPAARFQGAEEMAQALRAAAPEAVSAQIAVDPMLARAPDAATVCDRPARARGRWLAVSVLIAALGGGLWTMASRTSTALPRRIVVIQVEGIEYRGDIVEIRADQLQLREPGGIVRYWPVAAIERIRYEPAVAETK